jgi:hypothetical protein
MAKMAGNKFNHPNLHNALFYVHVGRSLKRCELENTVNIGGKLTRIGGQFLLVTDVENLIQKATTH